MLCERCEPQIRNGPRRPRATKRRGTLRCDRCGAAILTLVGVAVGVGDDILTLLDRFGLVPRGKPLLAPRRARA